MTILESSPEQGIAVHRSEVTGILPYHFNLCQSNKLTNLPARKRKTYNLLIVQDNSMRGERKKQREMPFNNQVARDEF